MANPGIIFVDDEVFFAQQYLKALQRVFEVTFCGSAENAVALIKHNTNLSAVVLDVMMPPPDEAENLTRHGLDTGLWVLGEVKDEIVSRRIGVLLLTNRPRSHIEDAVSEMGFPRGLVEVKSKVETPGRLLPDYVRALIESIQTNESME